jgi:hypothetical protein
MNSRKRDLELFQDKDFPNLKIKEYALQQLNKERKLTGKPKIKDDELIETLYRSLDVKEQILRNRIWIERGIQFPVNASGAIVLFLNTDRGLQLIYANSPRHKIVLATNGKCEKNESMEETARREFIEELGCPKEKGILRSIIENKENYYSLALTDKIGTNAEEIANNIIKAEAKSKKLYKNISCICVNTSKINYDELKKEIAQINEKLQRSAPFYTRACLLKYGNEKKGIKHADYSKNEDKEAALKVIRSFKEKCADIITPKLKKEAFDVEFNSEESIKKAISAIVDLAENNSVGLLPRNEIANILSLNFKQKETWEKLQNTYFLPSLQNILVNIGKKISAVQFLTNLENLAASVEHIRLPGTCDARHVMKEDDVTETLRSTLK